jgi:DnaK suppressor protein
MIEYTMNEEIFKKLILREISKTGKLVQEYREMSGPVAPDDAIGRITRMDAINNKSVTEASLRQAEQKLSGLKKVLSQVGMRFRYMHEMQITHSPCQNFVQA